MRLWKGWKKCLTQNREHQKVMNWRCKPPFYQTGTILLISEFITTTIAVNCGKLVRVFHCSQHKLSGFFLKATDEDNRYCNPPSIFQSVSLTE